MSELRAPAAGATVVRWRRFGHDRLYVKDAAGTDLGFWDLTTDTAHPQQECWRGRVEAAAGSWRASATASTPPPRAEQQDTPVVPESVPEPVLAERPWVDLATNRPAEETRAMATAAQAAAPVRTALGRMLGVRTEETSWRLGAVGEEKVAAQLRKLVRRDPRWRVLHAIPVGRRGADIDHLTIGPAGVFTLNAKHHRGAAIWVGGNTVLVDGQRQPYVRNSRHEASRAAGLLAAACGAPVEVQGLVVPVNAASVTIKSQPVDVRVVPRMQLAEWLLRHGETLAEEQVEKIYEVARRSTTWSEARAR